MLAEFLVCDYLFACYSIWFLMTQLGAAIQFYKLNWSPEKLSKALMIIEQNVDEVLNLGLSVCKPECLQWHTFHKNILLSWFMVRA